MAKKEEISERIINAALEEFGTKGYDLASTNTICLNANVAKGTIFLYFNSKAELFYEVFKTFLSKIVNDINSIKYSEGSDLYQKIVEVTIWKMKYYHEHAKEIKVLMEAIAKPPAEVVTKIKAHVHLLTTLSFDHFFNEIDMNEFSSEYTKEEVVRFLNYALNGMQTVIMNEKMTYEHLENIKDEAMKFLKTLLKGMKK